MFSEYDFDEMFFEVKKLSSSNEPLSHVCPHSSVLLNTRFAFMLRCTWRAGQRQTTYPKGSQQSPTHKPIYTHVCGENVGAAMSPCESVVCLFYEKASWVWTGRASLVFFQVLHTLRKQYSSHSSTHFKQKMGAGCRTRRPQGRWHATSSCTQRWDIKRGGGQ